MELKQLEYFLMVAQLENISKAANKLYISQPSLSRIMKDLENELDTTLFIKTNRKTTLTEDGLLLKQRATEIIELAHKTMDEFKGDDSNIYATIHIGAGETEYFSYIAKAAKRVTEQYPNIHFSFYSGIATDVLERIHRGSLDFGFLYEPINLQDLGAIYIKEYESLGILVRKDSRYASLPYVSIQQIKEMPLIYARTSQNQADDWFSEIFDDLHIVATGTLPSNSIKLVEEGIGNLVTIKMKQYDHLNHLKFIPFEQPLHRKWLLAWKKYDKMPKAHQIFINEFKEVIKMK